MQNYQEACWVAAQHEVWLVSTPGLWWKRMYLRLLNHFSQLFLVFWLQLLEVVIERIINLNLVHRSYLSGFFFSHYFTWVLVLNFVMIVMKMGEALNWFSPKKITGEKKRKFGAVWILCLDLDEWKGKKMWEKNKKANLNSINSFFYKICFKNLNFKKISYLSFM